MLFKTSLCCVLFVCNCSAMLCPSKAEMSTVPHLHVHTDTCQAHQDTAEVFLSTDCIMQPQSHHQQS